MVFLHRRVFRTIFTGGEQMSAATRARAPSGMTWEGIHWAKVQRQVRGLQTRIVKATQGGRYNKAKALQWLLTHSFSGKALAVKRVTENKGKNTPGGDKDQRDSVVEEAELFASSASASVYSEEKWQDKAARYTRDEMPRHASSTVAGVGTHRGDHRRSAFLWIQTGALNGRCQGTMLHCSFPRCKCALGAGGRHSK